MFRGAYVSRAPQEVLAEAQWLASQGVRELMLVSENSTSYGKDLGDLRLLEALIPELAAIDGLERVRVSYLQPAELRPGLIEVLAGTDKVAPYFDLSFQHANAAVLRRMRRPGNREGYDKLLARIRARVPDVTLRTTFIVGFPGETEADFRESLEVAAEAQFDSAYLFIFSPREGTAAAEMVEHFVDPAVAGDRFDRMKVVLDRTAFYPTSGGQPFDTGTLTRLGFGAGDIGNTIGDWKSLLHHADLDLLVRAVQSALDGIATKRKPAEIEAWLKDPKAQEAKLEKKPKMLMSAAASMKNGLSPEHIKDLSAYLATLTK